MLLNFVNAAESSLGVIVPSSVFVVDPSSGSSGLKCPMPFNKLIGSGGSGRWASALLQSHMLASLP